MGPDDLPVVITVAHDARSSMDELSERLGVHGLRDATSLSNIGIISGTAAAHAVERLRAQPGVAAVELAGGVQIAPPDSDVQ